MKITRLILAGLLTLSGCSLNGGVKFEEVDGKLVTTISFKMDHPRVVVDRLMETILPAPEEESEDVE